MNNCVPEVFGANPANIKWNVIRGDTATLLIQFFQNDEVTSYDTSLWSYIATAYDSKTDTYYTLDTEIIDNSVKVTAQPAVTALWGTGVKSKVAELNFDIEVTTGEDVVWTPVIGTITVTGDVTGVSVS
jgi:hypothetical protein